MMCRSRTSVLIVFLWRLGMEWRLGVGVGMGGLHRRGIMGV